MDNQQMTKQVREEEIRVSVQQQAPVQEQPVAVQEEKKENVTEQLFRRNTVTEVSSLHLNGGEPEELLPLQRRNSFQELSSTAEKRKEYLKNGRPMPQEMVQEYAQEYYAQQQAQRRQQEDPDEMLRRKPLKEVMMDAAKKMENLALLAVELNMDKHSASDSFTRLRDGLNSFVNHVIGGVDAEDFQVQDYVRLYAELRDAAKAYLDTHKGSRMREYGRKRQQAAQTIVDFLTEQKENYLDGLLVVNRKQLMDQGFNDDFLQETQRAKEQIWGEGDSLNLVPIDAAEIQRVAQSGSPEEKLKHLMNLNSYEELFGMHDMFTNAYGYRLDVEKVVEYKESIVKSLYQAPVEDRMKFLQLMAYLHKVAYDDIDQAYHKYLNEAPADMEPEAYAKVKLEKSASMRKWGIMTSLKRSLLMDSDFIAGPAGDFLALMGEISEHYPGYHEAGGVGELMEAVDQKRAAAEQRRLGTKCFDILQDRCKEEITYLLNSGYMRKDGVPCDQQAKEEFSENKDVIAYRMLRSELEDSKTKTAEESQRKEALTRNLKRAVEPFKPLAGLVREMKEDQNSASDSFLRLRSRADAFEKQCSQIRTSSSVSAIINMYQETKKAARAYLDTHKGWRFHDYGARRQEIAQQVWDLLESREQEFVSRFTQIRNEQLENNLEMEVLNREAEQLEKQVWGQDAPEPLVKENIKKIAESGTVEEKIKVLLDVKRYEEYIMDMGPEFKEQGVEFDEDLISDYFSDVIRQFQNCSPEELFHVMDVLAHLHQGNKTKLKKQYEEYRKQCPEGIHKNFFAEAKLESSVAVNQKRALAEVIREMESDIFTQEQVLMFRQMLRTIDGEDPDAEATEELIERVVTGIASESKKELKKGYALPVEKNKQQEVEFLIRSGLLRKPDGGEFSKSELENLKGKSEDIAYNYIREIIRKNEAQ